MNFKYALIVSMTAFLFGTPSLAADDCYHEEQITNRVMTCTGTSSRSADFTNGCKYEDVTETVRTPVECRKTWINAPAHWPRDTYKWGQICEFYGMENADFDGVICASASLQPQSGLNYELINDHQWKAPGRGMGSYRVLMEGGTTTLLGSLMSGMSCLNRSSFAAQNATGIFPEYLTARVCKQKGKVN